VLVSLKIITGLVEMREKPALEFYKSFILTRMRDYVVEMILDGSFGFFVTDNSLMLFLIPIVESRMVVKKKHLILLQNNIME